MSYENVEIAQQGLEHFRRTGEPQWETVDPAIEVYDHDIPDAGSYRGHEGYARWPPIQPRPSKPWARRSSVSQENVEIVRRGVEAYASGDVKTLLDVADPQIEWKQVEEPEPARGYEGVAWAMVRWNEIWDDPRIEAEEYIDGGDRIVVLIRHRGRGKASGVEIDMASYHLFTVRQRRIVAMYEFGPGKRAEALEAVGLSE